MKFYQFIIDRGAKVKLTAIDGPPTAWKSPLDLFQAVYKHEQKVTGLINNLVDLSIKEKDHATNAFLQWFVNEQVEEESSADAIVQKLKLIKDSPDALFMLDRELGQRVFTPPAQPAE
jgi:ferritin